MTRSRLTRQDALTFWRARDTHRFQVWLSYLWLLLCFLALHRRCWDELMLLLGLTVGVLWAWPLTRFFTKGHRS